MVSLPVFLRQLGRTIRNLRERTGYSQERLGFAVGLHRTYMGHLERGTANPSVRTLHRVAQGLGVSVPELLAMAAAEAGEAASNRPGSRRSKAREGAGH
jgi:transcriptional regulator with XRE-family HTH domain